MSLTENLRAMERTREAYWRRYPSTSPTKLRWRATTVRHCLHVLPGETVLELGAGSGLWTVHLASVLRGENPITMAVFDSALAEEASAKELENTTVELVSDVTNGLQAEFDYVVGTAILCHDRYAENLRVIHRLLKPGGRLFFFESNFWNPQVLVKDVVPAIGRWAGNAGCQIGMRKYRLLHAVSSQGFTDVEIIPFDIVHARTPRKLVESLNSVAFLFEHLPAIRELCGTLYISAKKPGDEQARRPRPKLTSHRDLAASTSVVAPCRNESMNLASLVKALLRTYDDYITEIILVVDRSTDSTAEVASTLASQEPRVRFIHRTPPAGVGRALRDGYAAAAGRYILSMDCDFEMIVPELRDLFDSVAAGREGAIGSRFSHESILVNYPVIKILGNRGFHLLVRLLFRLHVRDISNNLKLFRADILKALEIEEPGFAANVETGLKPILAGHDIEEVPISWINRTDQMGASSFGVLSVVPSYVRVMRRLVRAAQARTPNGRTQTVSRDGVTRSSYEYTG
jgi:SAM-dependent methyltransferase